MPAMTPGETFLRRAMTAAEGTLCLREILHAQGFGGDLERYSSHAQLESNRSFLTAKSSTMTYKERLTQELIEVPIHEYF